MKNWSVDTLTTNPKHNTVLKKWYSVMVMMYDAELTVMAGPTKGAK